MTKLLQDHGIENSTVDIKINIPSKYSHFVYEKKGNEVVKVDLETNRKNVARKKEIDLMWPDWYQGEKREGLLPDKLPVFTCRRTFMDARRSFLGKILVEFFLVNLRTYLKMTDDRKVKLFVTHFNLTARENLTKIYGENDRFQTYSPMGYQNQFTRVLSRSNIRDFFFDILKEPKMTQEQI